MKFIGLAAAGSMLSLSLAGAAAAADLGVSPLAFAPSPAVDGVNYKVEAFGGSSAHRILGPRFDSAWSAGLAGAVAIPVGQSFGLQVDAALASVEGDVTGAGAAHVFWRNPASALIGLYGSWSRRSADDSSQVRLGLEAQYYLARVTLGGVGGFERTIAAASTLTVPGFGVINLPGSQNRAFAAFDLSWYATDNFRLSGGYRYFNGRSAAAAGLEYMVQTGQGAAYSFFAEGRAGEDRYLAGMAGVRVYFGQKDKTLIRRHREDDPPNYLPESMFAPRGAGATPGEPGEINCAVTPRRCDT